MKNVVGPTSLEQAKPPVRIDYGLLSSAIVGIIAIGYGLYRAYDIRWLCDDAFITFRYADNYLCGLGFVFNAGEHVEGYSHFLWLCLITLFRWFGMRPESSAVWIGLFAYVATLRLFLWLSYKTSPPHSFVMPFITIALALHYDFSIWATGGLETSLFTFLISLGVIVACYVEAGTAPRFFFSGLIFVLGALTRPDGIIFWGLCLLFLTTREFADGKPLRLILRAGGYYALPFLVIYVPYLIWKIEYYGDILPNTYYAKSGDVSYYTQGFFYIWTYLRGYASTWLVLLIIPFLMDRWRKSPGTLFRRKLSHVMSDASVRAGLLATLFILVYGVLFVAKVGGDFMYARFLQVLIPLIYFVIGISLVNLLGHKRVLLNLSMIVVLIIVVYDRTRRDDYLTTHGAYGDGVTNTLSGIGDERWYWTHDLGRGKNLTELQSMAGTDLKQLFEGTNVTVLLRGQNNFAYYASFRTCIEGAGLTDSYIAHLPLEHRGKPGHEKVPPREYLLSRRENFIFMRKGDVDTSDFRKFSVYCGYDSLWGYIITYDRDLLLDLEGRLPYQVSYVKFDEYLDSYIQKMKTKKVEEVRADFKTFEGYYFRWVSDEKRLNVFREFLEGRGGHAGSR